MKAYVTGGTGFVGSHLVEQLVDQGYHVTCLIRKTSNLRWLNHLLTARSSQIRLVTADLQDSDTLVDHLRNADLVFHLIADALEKRPLKVKVPLFLLNLISIFTEAAAKITRQVPTLNRQRVRDLKQQFWICDSTKAQKELGYRPIYSLQKGIQETADWYRANGWL